MFISLEHFLANGKYSEHGKPCQIAGQDILCLIFLGSIILKDS